MGGFVKMGHQESSNICSLLSLILIMLFYLNVHHQLSLFLFFYFCMATLIFFEKMSVSLISYFLVSGFVASFHRDATSFTECQIFRFCTMSKVPLSLSLEVFMVKLWENFITYLANNMYGFNTKVEGKQIPVSSLKTLNYLFKIIYLTILRLGFFFSTFTVFQETVLFHLLGMVLNRAPWTRDWRQHEIWPQIYLSAKIVLVR